VELSEPLRRQLIELVLGYIGTDVQTGAVRDLVGAEGLRRLPNGNGYTRARWIVTYSLIQTTADVFVSVVKQADAGGAVQELHELVQRIQQGELAWTGSVGNGLWVPVNWPFVDRASLRSVLETMAGGAGPAALVIEGPLGQGKQTMADYVTLLAEGSASFSAAVVELRPIPDMLFSMASEIYAAIGADPDLGTTHEEPERQATILARQVAQAAAAAPAPTWFVANVFDPGNLEPGVLPFVDDLLDLVQGTAAIATKLRVVVLCDQFSLLELENAPPVDARFTLPSITETEVREWFEASVPGKSAALYELTAGTVMTQMQQANLPSQRWLATLSAKCRKAHQDLSAMPDA
jgi:hypothetical protein